MSKRVLGFIGLATVVVALGWCVSGCEDDVETDEATSHFSTPYASEERTDGGLVIYADRTYLVVENESVEVMARGGQPPYGWYIEDSSLGEITSKGDKSCTYKRFAKEGNNTLYCRDGAGDRASIPIYQYEPSTNEVAEASLLP